MRKFTACIRRFIDDCRGMILPELAVALPILVLLTLGGAELSRYVLLHQKLNRSVATVGDLVSQGLDLTEQTVTDTYDSVEHVMQPFSLGDQGLIIVSSVLSEPNPNDPTQFISTIQWQRCGGGSLSRNSRIGQPGDLASFTHMTTPFVMPDGKDVIVAEIFYNYAPTIIGGVTGAHEIYDIVIYTPRIVPLVQVNPGDPPGEVSACPSPPPPT